MVLVAGVSFSFFFGRRYWVYHQRQVPIRDAALVAPRPVGADLMIELGDFLDRETNDLPRAHRELFNETFDTITVYRQFFDRFEARFGTRLAQFAGESATTFQPGLLDEYPMETPYGHALEEFGLSVLHLAYFATVSDLPELRVRCLEVARGLMRLTLAWPGLDLLGGTWFWRTKYYEFVVFHGQPHELDGPLAIADRLPALFEGAVYLDCATFEQRLLDQRGSWPPPLLFHEPAAAETLFELRDLYADLRLERPGRPLFERFPLPPRWQIRAHHFLGDVRFMAARIENGAAYLGLEIALLDAARLHRGLDGAPSPAAVRAEVERLQLRNPFDGKLYRVDARGRLLVLPGHSPLLRILGTRGDLGAGWSDLVVIPNGS